MCVLALPSQNGAWNVKESAKIYRGVFGRDET